MCDKCWPGSQWCSLFLILRCWLFFSSPEQQPESLRPRWAAEVNVLGGRLNHHLYIYPFIHRWSRRAKKSPVTRLPPLDPGRLKRPLEKVERARRRLWDLVELVGNTQPVTSINVWVLIIGAADSERVSPARRSLCCSGRVFVCFSGGKRRKRWGISEWKRRETEEGRKWRSCCRSGCLVIKGRVFMDWFHMTKRIQRH